MGYPHKFAFFLIHHSNTTLTIVWQHTTTVTTTTTTSRTTNTTRATRKILGGTSMGTPKWGRIGGGAKQEDEQTFLKEYYICSEKKPKGTCGAKKRIHHLPGGDIMECVGTHNHLPPEKVKTDPDIQRKFEDYSNVGAKATAIQARLMKEASEMQQPITRKNVPTKQHIYNTKHKMMMAELPTSMNSLHNITLTLSSPNLVFKRHANSQVQAISWRTWDCCTALTSCDGCCLNPVTLSCLRVRMDLACLLAATTWSWMVLLTWWKRNWCWRRWWAITMGLLSPLLTTSPTSRPTSLTWSFFQVCSFLRLFMFYKYIYTHILFVFRGSRSVPTTAWTLQDACSISRRPLRVRSPQSSPIAPSCGITFISSKQIWGNYKRSGCHTCGVRYLLTLVSCGTQIRRLSAVAQLRQYRQQHQQLPQQHPRRAM